MILQLRVGGTYIARCGLKGKVVSFVEDKNFPYEVEFEGYNREWVTIDGRYTRTAGDHRLDLICEDTEEARMYLFFASKHSGKLSDKWKDFED